MACPRCGDEACQNPDDKRCSDHCIGRLNKELREAVELLTTLRWAMDAAHTYTPALRERYVRFLQQHGVEV